MPLITDQAVVLRRLDFSETSQVLVLLTRAHGKVRAIAKGVKRSTRRRFAVGIDLLEAGELGLFVRRERGHELAKLTEWKQTRAFCGLRESLARLYAAQYAAEVTSGLTEDWDPHVRIYDTLLALLQGLCELDEPLAAVTTFLSRLLDEIGSAPRFDACVACGRAAGRWAGPVHFSSHQGGLLCRDCESAYVEKRQVAPPALSVLRGLGGGGEDAWAAAFDLLNYHTSHLMGRAPLLAGKLRRDR